MDRFFVIRRIHPVGRHSDDFLCSFNSSGAFVFTDSVEFAERFSELGIAKGAFDFCAACSPATDFTVDVIVHVDNQVDDQKCDG